MNGHALPVWRPGRHAERVAAGSWWVALAGYAAMFLPVYWWAGNSIWQSEEQGHGALILAVVVWLFWRQHRHILAAPTTARRGWATPVFVVGVALYLMGRIFDISVLEFAAQPLVVASLLLLLSGTRALRVAWFPVFYLLFMIPVPGPIVDAVTGPLKQAISHLVVELLYDLGYPISRSGVVITIGQYQMLVADACSGLHSMISLSALGTLYLFLMERRSIAHNIVMLLAILPIAFAANIVRVIVLVLITYHFGDDAGQGFLHGAAGVVLLLAALLFLFALDHVLVRVFAPHSRALAAAPAGASRPVA
jgi:exosortase B